MKGNKFGWYVLLGAMAGAIISLGDRRTREQIVSTTKNCLSDIRYYSNNRDVLKTKITEKAEKYQSIYEQFSSDASYLKEKVNELKELSPQVKELVVDTKDAFSESKDEYKSLVSENSSSEETNK